MARSDDVTRARLGLADQIKRLEELKTWRDTLPRVCLVASAQVVRTDAAARALYTIPAGHEAHLLVVHGEAGSDATTATLDIGRPGAVAAFVNGHDLAGPAGVGQRFPDARKLGVVAGADVVVTGRVRETGTPSTLGGPWTVTVFYSKAGN